jgi:LacI family transcriptional regulator, galactose operon repressor
LQFAEFCRNSCWSAQFAPFLLGVFLSRGESAWIHSDRNDFMNQTPNPPISDIPRIAVLIETSNSVRRDLVLGISRYARLNGPWSLHIGSCEYDEIVPKMKTWGTNGIIAPIPNARIGKALIDAGLPTIAVCLKDEQRAPKSPWSKLSEVAFDAAEIVAKLATEHFLERHFRHFAFVGLDDVTWSERRARAFRAQLNAAGFEPLVYRQPVSPRNRVWEREQDVLTEWIRGLPKPIGILACNDQRGRMVLDCCRMADFQVPEQVAVLGVDNDEEFCSMADPPLSSVALSAENSGYEVAELLDGIMRGRVRKPSQVSVEAVGIVARRSTDVSAVNDSDVSAALRFIREQHGRQISVADVANAVLLSRRGLEKRFRTVLGRTILEEIQTARIETAKRLLADTSHLISQVAELAGFGTIDYFIRLFRQRVGKSPAEFRGACGVGFPERSPLP